MLDYTVLPIPMSNTTDIVYALLECNQSYVPHCY